MNLQELIKKLKDIGYKENHSSNESIDHPNYHRFRYSEIVVFTGIRGGDRVLEYCDGVPIIVNAVTKTKYDLNTTTLENILVLT